MYMVEPTVAVRMSALLQPLPRRASATPKTSVFHWPVASFI
jgi:hypothetical protein